MSILASVAKVFLKLDNSLQRNLSGFWFKRADTLQQAANATVRQADAALTAELAKVEADYKNNMARLARQMADRRDDDCDKAYARRDIVVNDAQDDKATADTIARLGLNCYDRAAAAHAALKALGGGV